MSHQQKYGNTHTLIDSAWIAVRFVERMDPCNVFYPWVDWRKESIWVLKVCTAAPPAGVGKVGSELGLRKPAILMSESETARGCSNNCNMVPAL